MSARPKLWRFSPALIAALTFALGLSASMAGQLKVGRVDLSYEGVSDDLAARFAETAANAADAIEKLLGRESPGTVKIILTESLALPNLEAKDRMVTIPSNRVRGDAGGPPAMRGRGPGIVHHLVLILTPTRNTDARWLLEEGLAVYLQEKLGGTDRAVPNMGLDVHEETARVVAGASGFVRLRDPVAARTLNEPGCTIQNICLQQGSFVRYLIETHGLDKFMSVYDGATFEAAYGVSPERLEADWQAFIKTLIDRRRP